MPDMHQDHIALDRASVRTIDPTSGHMHVSVTNISKATVNPYNGSEIPGAAELGLSPNKVYRLLRDPAELEKAAPTFEGKPLLDLHKPQSAADHDHNLTVGSVSNVRWNAPFLQAALAVWDGEAIKGIEDNSARELSCGYYYEPDMTPGVFEGERYDGVMRNIRGNHVALVDQGRAGPDVMVGDSAHNPKPQVEIAPMATKALSRQALLVSGALRAYLGPKMAADKKVDLNPIVGKLNAKTWKADKPKLKAALDKALVGKLAADADIEDVIELLDQLDDVTEEVAAATAAPGVGDLDDDTVMDADDDMVKRVSDMLKAKGMSDEDIAAVCAAMKPEVTAPAADTDPPRAGDPPVKPEVTKAGMDAAIKLAADSAAKDAETRTIARLRAIQAAERDVKPFIGEIAIAQDSAAAVYKLALDHLKVDLTDVPPEAFGALLKAMPAPGAHAPRVAPRMAADAAAAADRLVRFPNANRLLAG